MKSTHNLQIKAFPYELNKALKIKALKEGLSFRDFVITTLRECLKAKPTA